MIPLNTHVRLVEDDPSSMSLEEVFAEYCDSTRMTVDQPIMQCYDARLLDLRRRLKNGLAPRDIRKEIFDNIRRVHTPSDILSRYLRGTFQDHTELWMFKRQFTNQLALSAFATYVLALNKHAPHNIDFLLKNGNILPWDLAPCLNAAGRLDSTRDQVSARIGWALLIVGCSASLCNSLCPMPSLAPL